MAAGGYGPAPDVDDKLQEIEHKFERLTADLGDPTVLADPVRFKATAKERSQLEPLVEAFREFKRVRADLREHEALLDDADPDMREMAKDELPRLRTQVAEMEGKLKILLLPKDPNDERDVILEVRAGAGGDEAGLFASEVLRMYLRYAERRNWRSTLMDVSTNAAGGIKDASVTISGEGVYSNLKYESGVHRVQRVPATEAQGRIHTSTVTVSVMPEAEEVDVQVNPADIQMDVMRSTGAGGQSVNTTDSAVRLTHKPTGVVVKCQQEKSQLKNRAMALKMLRTKLYEMELEKQQSARDAARKSQVGTGDRSEKIRTYNFP
ncbi:MAG: peptide chain release factor 1, partial [Myxococcales bacterium]